MVFQLFALAVAVLPLCHGQGSGTPEREILVLPLTSNAFGSDVAFLSSLASNTANVRRKYDSEADPVRRTRRDVASLTNNNGGFHTQISISGQRFTVLVDTGSSVLWVPAVACSSCAGASKFDTSRSSSFSYTNGAAYSQSVTYGSGAVTGTPARDVLQWSNSVANPQPFLLASSIDNSIRNQLGSSEGIMGLTYQGGMDGGQQHETVAYYLASQGKLQNNVFGLWINPNTAIGSSDPNGGKLLLGGVDTSLYYGSFTFLPIIPSEGPGSYNYYWAVSSGSLSIPGFPTISPPGGSYTFFDSATTLITLDGGSFQTVINYLSSRNPSAFRNLGAYYSVDCTVGRSLPDVTVTMGGTAFVLSNSDYVVPVPNNVVCVLGIATAGMDFWIFGEVFLRKFFSLHDLQNNRIGFAVTANGNGNGIAPSLGTPPSPPPAPQPPINNPPPPVTAANNPSVTQAPGANNNGNNNQPGAPPAATSGGINVPVVIGPGSSTISNSNTQVAGGPAPPMKPAVDGVSTTKSGDTRRRILTHNLCQHARMPLEVDNFLVQEIYRRLVFLECKVLEYETGLLALKEDVRQLKRQPMAVKQQPPSDPPDLFLNPFLVYESEIESSGQESDWSEAPEVVGTSDEGELPRNTDSDPMPKNTESCDSSSAAILVPNECSAALKSATVEPAAELGPSNNEQPTILQSCIVSEVQVDSQPTSMMTIPIIPDVTVPVADLEYQSNSSLPIQVLLHNLQEAAGECKAVPQPNSTSSTTQIDSNSPDFMLPSNLSTLALASSATKRRVMRFAVAPTSLSNTCTSPPESVSESPPEPSTPLKSTYLAKFDSISKATSPIEPISPGKEGVKKPTLNQTNSTRSPDSSNTKSQSIPSAHCVIKNLQKRTQSPTTAESDTRQSIVNSVTVALYVTVHIP
ncbi:acid protease [Rhizoclosmatium globosum]|uniref:Acid protease n=1 Tax=Rhizoclosmatium globosum TaxID=329046 RepID=A0A1Y2CUC4_9FUNG|nr:acid protease [Rhizoclosmatium globosum]|eukprot:ORY50486.1 acid protease [Rhizoclosmatium globosum]